ncbi:MAG TPA: adenylate/guanylate cyclase domain-containing protein, partial [Candidatus Nitrosotenuis sp.]|nr:adenylate/guanylate cyclase domain-containing protein [Candidatus Nitrosotenuis sp.]
PRARVVVLDFMQLYPSRPSADPAQPWAEEPPDLARAAGTHPVILAARRQADGSLLASIPPVVLLAAQRPLPPALRSPGQDGPHPEEVLGLVNAPRDPDQRVRRLDFFSDARWFAARTLNLPCSWFQAARYALDLPLARFRQAWQKVEEGAPELDLEGLRVPLTGLPAGSSQPRAMLVNYAGPAGTLPTLSFGEVLRRSEKPDRAWLDAHFQGKVVFLGVTLPDYQDEHFTPLEWAQRPREGMSGVEILANATNTLLTGQFLRPLGAGWTLAGALTWALAAATAAFFLPLRWLAPALLGLVIAWYAAGLALFCGRGLVVPLVLPEGATLLALAGAFAWRQMTTEAQRRQARRLLGRYLSDPVARHLEQDPSAARLGGRSAEVTVLFSDLNDFTAWGEKTDPEQVVQVLNEYFAEMERIIFQNQGTLKHFIGDEIVVLFGAPFPQEDMELRAVSTALAMQEGLQRLGDSWARRGLPRLQAKMGIHRGRVLLGNVGSPRRTEYTAIGDTVNLASRVMNLARALGHSILLTEEVYQRVRQQVEAVELPSQTVKGRQAPVKVYGLAGLRPPPSP